MPRIKHRGLFKRCGHAERAWLTCADPWWFRFHHGGKEHRFSLIKEEGKPSGYVMSKDDARLLQRKYQTQIEAGTFRQPPAATPGDARLTVNDLLASPLMKALITAALETGCRMGELLALTWADVKWDDNLLLLPAAITKTREARGVPISQNLKAVLDLRRHAPDGSEHDGTGHAFGNECGEPVSYWRVREEWRTTCDAAGAHGVNFHDLRRTSASMLRMSGAPDHLVAAWLGHTNISTDLALPARQ